MDYRIEVDQEIMDNLVAAGAEDLAARVLVLEHHIAVIESELLAYRVNCLCGAASHHDELKTNLVTCAPLEN